MGVKDVDQSQDQGVVVMVGDQRLSFSAAEDYFVDSGFLNLTRHAGDPIATFAPGKWDSAMVVGIK